MHGLSLLPRNPLVGLDAETLRDGNEGVAFILEGGDCEGEDVVAVRITGALAW